MRTRLVLATVVAALNLAACGSSDPGPDRSERVAAREAPEKEREPELPPPTPRHPAAALDTSYRGTLPCADCTGIDATYRFTANPGEPGGTYQSTWVYLGKSDPPVEKSGTWVETQGQGGRADAIVYQIDPDLGSDSRYFLVVSDDRIEMLDRDRKRIRGRQNYTLMKVSIIP